MFCAKKIKSTNQSINRPYKLQFVDMMNEVWRCTLHPNKEMYSLPKNDVIDKRSAKWPRWLFPLIARFTRPTWSPSGTDRTQMGPMLVPWTLLLGLDVTSTYWHRIQSWVRWHLCKMFVAFEMVCYGYPHKQMSITQYIIQRIILVMTLCPRHIGRLLCVDDWLQIHPILRTIKAMAPRK